MLERIRSSSASTTDPEEALRFAQLVKSLKPVSIKKKKKFFLFFSFFFFFLFQELDKAKAELPPYDPIIPPPFPPDSPKIIQVKAIIIAALEEVALVLR